MLKFDYIHTENLFPGVCVQGKPVDFHENKLLSSVCKDLVLRQLAQSNLEPN